MKGKIVSSPYGWERGPAVESSEGCLYPTWVRVKEPLKKKRKKPKKRSR